MANYNKSFNFRNGVQVDEDDLIVRSSLVGIGTTIPRAELDVYGTVRSTGIITANNLYVAGVGTFSNIQIGLGITIDGNSGIITAKFSGDGAGLFNIPTSQWVDVDPAIYPGVGVGYSSIWAGGTVGIGTTIPRSWLQVGGDPGLGQEGVGISSIGSINASGIVTAGFLVGSGASVTNINASNIASGTLNNDRLPSDISVSGVVTAGSFVGNSVNYGVGVVTFLSGTNINYSGFGTITSLVSTSTTSINISGTIGTITNLNSTSANITNLSGTIGTVTNLSGVNLNYTGVATAGIVSATIANIGIITSNNIKSGDIQLGITASNQVDTSTGNLVLDSNGGLVDINDNVDVSGTSTLQGEVTVNTGVVPDTSTGAYLGQLGKEFSELWVDEIKIGVGVGNSNKIETISQDLVLDSNSNQIVVDSNLRVVGVTTLTDTLTLSAGIEPSTDEGATLGTASKRFSSSQIAAIRVGVAQTFEIDTVNGTDLVLDSGSGTTRITDDLLVSGIGSFAGELTAGVGLVPDTDNGAYLGTEGKRFSEAFVRNLTIGVADANEIDTLSGNLRLNADSGQVQVLTNLSVSGVTTISSKASFSQETNFIGLSTFYNGISPDTDKGAFIGTEGKAFSSAHINEIRIGIGATNKIDTREGSLRLNGSNNIVNVENNLNVDGVSTLLGNSILGTDNAIFVNSVNNRVGIGTSTLTRKFEVKDTSDLVVEFKTDTSAVTIGLGRSTVGAGQSVGRITHSGKTLSFVNEDSGGIEYTIHTGVTTSGISTEGFKWFYGQNGSELMSLTHEGSLGIGITNPSHTLHVVGTSTITGNAFFGGNVTIAGILSTSNLTIDALNDVSINNSSGISTFYEVGISSTLVVTGFTSVTSIGIGTDVPRVAIDALEGGIILAERVGVGTTGLYTYTDPLDPDTSFTMGLQLSNRSLLLDGGQLLLVSGEDSFSNVGLNTYIARSVLDFGIAGVASTIGGYFIAPTISTSNRNQLSNFTGIGGTVEGAIIYNSTTKKHQGYGSTNGGSTFEWHDLY